MCRAPSARRTARRRRARRLSAAAALARQRAAACVAATANAGLSGASGRLAFSSGTSKAGNGGALLVGSGAASDGRSRRRRPAGGHTAHTALWLLGLGGGLGLVRSGLFSWGLFGIANRDCCDYFAGPCLVSSAKSRTRIIALVVQWAARRPVCVISLPAHVSANPSGTTRPPCSLCVLPVPLVLW